MSVTLVSSLTASVQHPAYLYASSDPLPHWSHPHNWSAEDDCLLLPAAEMERYSSICRGHNLDIAPMASHRVFGRALWNFCLIWRLFRDYWLFCRKHTCDRPVHTDGTGKDIRWEKECRITCVRCK